MIAEQGKTTLLPGQFERIAKALADPRRFSLLQQIAQADNSCPYQKLCQLLRVTKATISHHRREPVSDGLIETDKDGQYVHARVVPGVIEAYSLGVAKRVNGGREPAGSNG